MDRRLTFQRTVDALAAVFIVAMFFAHEITLALALITIAIGWYSGHPINVLCGLLLAIGPFANIVHARYKAYRSLPN